MSGSNKPIAVSMGDPCGIGPDVILKCWAQHKAALSDFFVVGSADALEQRAKLLGINVDLSTDLEGQAGEQLKVFELQKSFNGVPAKPESADAVATIEAIDQGVDLVVRERASALVTAPINKKTLYDVGFSHPGHTEYLAELAQKHYGGAHMPVMMLAGPDLRTIPVTIHIPLAQVHKALTTALIVQTGEIASRDLNRRFGIKNPRLAIAGLNPHAGESGALGTEENDIIAPAVKQLQSVGIEANGPLPADTMFHANAREAYDVALCMYHDQALIPAKMLGFDDAANITLGLPFIRTSPDHGTAYDIAGTGLANPSSFIAALKTAAQMVGNS